jgi:hypothetical protein
MRNYGTHAVKRYQLGLILGILHVPYLGMMFLMTPKWLVPGMDCGIDECPQFRSDTMPEFYVPTLIIRVYVLGPQEYGIAGLRYPAQIGLANLTIYIKMYGENRSTKLVSPSKISKASPEGMECHRQAEVPQAAKVLRSSASLW